MRIVSVSLIVAALSGCVSEKTPEQRQAAMAAFGNAMSNYGNPMRANAPVTCNQRYLGYGNYTTTCN
jgi:hypothetical protein